MSIKSRPETRPTEIGKLPHENPHSFCRPKEIYGKETYRIKIIARMLDLSLPKRLRHQIATRKERLLRKVASLETGGYSNPNFADNLKREEKRLAQYATNRFWRLMPYGIWICANGSIVVFDREYCPICRFAPGQQPEIIHPLERIQDIVEERWFYEEATSPYCDPDTLHQILSIAMDIDMMEEVHRRQVLSDFGRIPFEIWAKKWQPG